METAFPGALSCQRQMNRTHRLVLVHSVPFWKDESLKDMHETWNGADEKKLKKVFRYQVPRVMNVHSASIRLGPPQRMNVHSAILRDVKMGGSGHLTRS